jgi:hypothetical protein
MTASRRKVPYWRRGLPAASFDIAKLRPKKLVRGKRFETTMDAREESLRSEELLTRYRTGNTYSLSLQECRAGHYHCDQTYCPLCARRFRRYFIGELLRLNSESESPVQILVVLLESASRGGLSKLQIKSYRHSLRKRLERAGLGDAHVIGGFEMTYRARSKEWVLHLNLAIYGGDDNAVAKFEDGLGDAAMDRPVRRDVLKNPAEQLSYLLKFTTYHRPHQQHGATRSRARPLNPRDHYELVTWMAQLGFSEHVFLFNARRRGASIELASNEA